MFTVDTVGCVAVNWGLVVVGVSIEILVNLENLYIEICGVV
jgi:hypothetical protein